MLEECRSLRCIHFSAYQSLAWVAVMLSYALPTLTSVHIAGFPCTIEELESLASILNPERFPCLETVELRLFNFSLLSKTTSRVDVTAGGLRRIFPILHEHGILRV